ncbi:MAG TPA: ankyrin repeat domain-containing protein [Kofleriaceae bacterium]
MGGKKRAAKKRGDHLTPLMWACIDEDLVEVKKLIANGVDVNEATLQSDDENKLVHVSFQILDAGRTALMIASGDMGKAQIPIMTALLDAGAKPDAANAQGTPLCFAASAASIQAIELLLSRGADVNQRASFTPLHSAADAGTVEVVKFLLERGAEVDARIWTEATALMAARTPEVTALLLAHGADPRLRDRSKKTALHEAVERQTALFRRDDDLAQAATIDALLAKGADPSAADDEGITPLHIAAGLEREAGFEVVTRLLAAGAAPDARAVNGKTPLLRACELDRLDAAIAVIDAGGDLEARDGEGASPLALAARNGYVDLGCELLARGAARDPSLRELAKQNSRDDFVRMLDGEVVPAETYPKRVFDVCRRAEAHFKEGEYAAALELYRTVPDLYRDRIYACVSNIGYCLQQTGMHAESRVAFERALVLDPTANHLWRGLCYTYFELKRWDDMERCALQVTKLTPKDSWSWQQLAIARGERKDHRGAVKAGERAVALDPNNAYALFNLASGQKKLELPQYRKTFARALKLAPDLAQHLDPDDRDLMIKTSERKPNKQSKRKTGKPKASKRKPRSSKPSKPTSKRSSRKRA